MTLLTESSISAAENVPLVVLCADVFTAVMEMERFGVDLKHEN